MVRLQFRSEADLPAAAAAVRDALSDHGIVALPTETSYGLAVDPDDDIAVGRLFTLKRRPRDKALLVVGASLEQLGRLVRVPDGWRERLETAWPAPLTVVLPTAAGSLAAGSGSTLAVRVPAGRLLRALLAVVGPVTATSANCSGGEALASADAVAELLGHGLAVLLDGGTTSGGSPSTLVDLISSPPRVLRKGPWNPPAEWGVAS
jgi:L-threonylcarbamoyladenylate synthase